MRSLDRWLALPGGVFALLFVAALLEVSGDAFFQSAVHRTSGASRWASVAAGALSLSLYGLVVNLPRWNFGKLLGMYVVLFFVIAQVIARVKFHEPATWPVIVGGILITSGGLALTFSK
jgi:hypothetical protein